MVVADYIAERLKIKGVEYAFGVPGGEVAAMLESLRKVGIQFVLASHEAGASFMADAYYRRTGRISVVLTTLGPGATNAVTGAAQATLDRSPIIFITGAIDHALREDYPHQNLDHVAMFEPVSLMSRRVSAETVGAVIDETFDLLARVGPGAVHWDLPSDVARHPVENATLGGGDQEASDAVPFNAIASDVEDLLRDIERGQRVAFLVGIEAAHAMISERLTAVVDRFGIPVFTTYKAKGVLDERHPLSLGPVGLSPAYDAVAIAYLNSCKRVITLGLDPVELRSDWIRVWPELHVVEVGPKPHRFPAFEAERVVMSSIEGFLGALLERSPARRGVPSEIGEVRRGQERIIHEADALGAGEGLAPHRVLQMIDEIAHDSIVTIDTGAMRIAANHIVRAKDPNQVLQSNGLGTMGYGLSAAIGAQLVEPERSIVALTGDAGLLMLLGELMVAKARSLPIVVVVFVDDALSLIALKQSRMGYVEVGVEVAAPDFAGIAEAFGGVGTMATSLEEFQQQLREALVDREHLHMIHVPVNGQAYQALM